MTRLDPDAFRRSFADPAPPAGLSLAVQALWWDARGDWDRAHECAQDQNDATGALVHAYLHRVEGDPGNAAYWYRRAGRTPASGSLVAERDALIDELLGA